MLAENYQSQDHQGIAHNAVEVAHGVLAREHPNGPPFHWRDRVFAVDQKSWRIVRDLGPGEYRCHLENNLIHWVFGTKGAFKALRAEHGERLRMVGVFHATATPAGHLMHRDGGKHLADPIPMQRPSR